MNKQQLANKIWESANRMRSKIEANEYKDYILGFIFYKFLSDKEVEFLKKDGYEIRLYHPGWMNTYMKGTKEEHADLNPEEAARLALQSFFKIREQEKLVLDSYDGSIIPW